MPIFEQFAAKDATYKTYHHPRFRGTATFLNGCPPNRPHKPNWKDTVLRMREKGLKATGCNSAIRAINACLKWSESSPKSFGPQFA